MAGLLIAVAGIFVLYTFLGYPALLAMVASFRRSPGAPPETRTGTDDLPSMSVVLPVHDEAHQIEEVLESLAALRYPADRLQILIVSDGSTDGTDEIVRQRADRGVELLRIDERGGKCAAENAARAAIRGELVVNTDASVRFRPDALLRLAEAFEDPRVGVASGRDVSVARNDGDANSGEAGYVGYEMWVRDLETRAGGIVGASGCLYAIRRELHDTFVPPELSRDFAAALIARERGYAAVSVPEAVCMVPRTAGLDREYRRKVRTVTRGMATLWAWRELLNPWRHGAFAWKLASHKICRWLVPWAALVGGIGVVLAASSQAWLRPAALGIAAVLAVAVGAWRRPSNTASLPRAVAAVAFLVMTNVALIHALLRLVSRGSERKWEPTRRESRTRG